MQAFVMLSHSSIIWSISVFHGIETVQRRFERAFILYKPQLDQVRSVRSTDEDETIHELSGERHVSRTLITLQLARAGQHPTTNASHGSSRCQLFLWIHGVLPAICAESSGPAGHAREEQSREPEPKRILGIVPNYRTSPSLTNYKPISVREKFVDRQPGFLRPRYRNSRCGVCRRGAVDQLQPVVWTRRGRIRTLLRHFVCGLCHRQLHDRGDLSHYSAPGPALFPAWQGERMVKAGIRDRSDFLDSFRFGPHAVQLFGDSRQLDCGSDFERILPGQPRRGRRRDKAWDADWRRHGR